MPTTRFLRRPPAAGRPDRDAAARARLERAWLGRLCPLDEAEREAALAIVGAVLRRARLEAVEARVLDPLAAGAPVAGLPSLAQICRYVARIARDRDLAARDLRALRASRPPAVAALAARARPAAAEPRHAAPEPPAPAAPPRPAGAPARPAGAPARPDPVATKPAPRPAPWPPSPSPAGPAVDPLGAALAAVAAGLGRAPGRRAAWAGGASPLALTAALAAAS